MSVANMNSVSTINNRESFTSPAYEANRRLIERILIPLRRYDGIEEAIPSLEFLAQPGMEVIFLMRNAANLYPWWSVYDIGAFQNTATSTTLTNLAGTIAQQRQTQSVEERISSARRLLKNKGVTARLEFCSTSLKRAVRDYHQSDAKTIVLLGRRFRRLRPLALIVRHCLRRFGKEDVRPTLLLRSEGNF